MYVQCTYPQIIYHTAENYAIMRRLLLRRLGFHDYKHVKIFIRYAFTLLYTYIVLIYTIGTYYMLMGYSIICAKCKYSTAQVCIYAV